MKESTKLILKYLLVYIILGLIYGSYQNSTVCINMQGFECNFNENKLIAFFTIVAYILTPIVAIYGFQSWKIQYKYQNQKDRLSKLFECSLKLNSELKILRTRDIAIRSKNLDETKQDYVSNYLDVNYENYLDKIDHLERIYEECLSHISILEFSLNKKMNGLKKIIHNHQSIYEDCRQSYLNLLKSYDSNNGLSRDLYLKKVSYRKEMKEISLLKIINPKKAEIEYEKTSTQKIIRMTDRINKYINKIEKFY